MDEGKEWIKVGNRLELHNHRGEPLISEVTRDGRCVVFDLSPQKKSLKDTIRQYLGYDIRMPRVIMSTYRPTLLGQNRQQIAQTLSAIDKQKIPPDSKRILKRKVLQDFRIRFPHGMERD